MTGCCARSWPTTKPQARLHSGMPCAPSITGFSLRITAHLFDGTAGRRAARAVRTAKPVNDHKLPQRGCFRCSLAGRGQHRHDAAAPVAAIGGDQYPGIATG